MLLSYNKMNFLFVDGLFAQPLATTFDSSGWVWMIAIRQLFFDLNMLGVGVQFLYRYLVLNRLEILKMISKTQNFQWHSNQIAWIFDDVGSATWDAFYLQSYIANKNGDEV